MLNSIRLQVPPNVFESTIYFVVGALDFPSYRIRCNANWVFFAESLHQTAELIRVSWIDLNPTSFSTQRQIMDQLHRQTHSPYGIPIPQYPDFPLPSCQMRELQEQTQPGVQSLSHLQDLSRGDNTIPSSVGEHQGRSQYKGSGSYRSQVSVSHLGRWKGNRWSSCGSWWAVRIGDVIRSLGTASRERGAKRCDAQRAKREDNRWGQPVRFQGMRRLRLCCGSCSMPTTGQQPHFYV